MTTAVLIPQRHHIPPGVRRITLDEYHHLIDTGFFKPDERVELLEGVLITMAPQRPPHANCVSLLNEEFYECLGKTVTIRPQSPITIPSTGSEPEPDVVLARRLKGGYAKRHPQPDDILLVIEVSDTTLFKDLDQKAAIYAAAGLPDYWVMNLVDLCIKVHRDPIVLPDGTAKYQTEFEVGPGKSLTPLHFPQCKIQVNSVIPMLRELFGDSGA